ncbi:hypothetical protein [Massilia sp.]|uniref:hypothetical protein n=1 Tax=Massilia sp. TaxID=1882437 RepID=UPI0028AF3664|nr:hypothetical protein [Massilia sp.]
MYPYLIPGKALRACLRAALPVLLLVLGTSGTVAAGDTAPGWQLSGFGTFGAAHSSERHADYSSSAMKASGAGRSHDWSPQVDSKLGLQADLRLGPRWSGVLQVVSEQHLDYSYRPRVEWANLKYQATPELALRFGRIALPVFVAADYRKVGYAYPWVRTPVELYGAIPLSNSDGADLTWRWDGDAVRGTTQVFAGRTTVPLFAGAHLRGSGIAGLSQTIERGDLSVRASFITTRLTITLFPELFAGLRAFGPPGQALADSLAVEHKRATGTSIGLNYDPGQWFVLGEAGHYAVDAYLGASDSAYASAGYRHGAFTPYLGYARTWGKPPAGPHALALDRLSPSMAQAGALLNASVGAMLRAIPSQSTSTLGLRWDAGQNVALKLQFDRVTPRAGSRGTMMNLGPGFRSGRTAQVTSATLDFVF